ncbi:MAG: NEW3 domain-containing protein [Chloroflexota bacterium]|nr:NEW3 domain-containing protein [Chloroflexota bacterium]
MEILAAHSTDLFVGTEKAPRQVVRVRLRGGRPLNGHAPAQIRIEGNKLRTAEAVALGPLGPGEEARLELGVVVDAPLQPGSRRKAEVIVQAGGKTSRHAFELVVVEPGWQMFMVSHFHYDPVWWNTQAAYTETWGTAIQYRSPYQEPGLALVRSHLEMARRDPIYKFVLAELDYLKPYWDVYPEDRAYIRQLLADGRLEFMGGTYNEPNTNLTSAESTIRNAIYGVGYQRDVLGGAPATAWQLDAFGHDPQFPGIMADAGVSSSSWARGPFHEWGPHWVRGPGRVPFAEMAAGETPQMQFPTEFDWIAPSGRALLTCFMANHYSSGWWMDAQPTLEEAEAEVHRLFTDLASLAATKNVLLPVGTDYTPPNKWLTAIQRDWEKRYVWPKFKTAIPREFFDAVRAEQKKKRRPFSPQTRDMNPIYTGKDVSFIDTKQAQRVAENTLLSGEKFATIAALLGARFPMEAIDKAWRQLLFGAHHDGITGSESDQVYLDLLGGWREAVELGKATLTGALDYLGARIDTTGEGRAVSVFNPLSWPRTDVARVSLDVPAEGPEGIELRDESGAVVPFVLETAQRRDDGRIVAASLAFIARDVPAVGYRSFRAVPSAAPLGDSRWQEVDRDSIENDAFAVTVDRARGGTIASLVDRRSGKQLVQPGGGANELRAYREYPTHPLFGEGPWHLTPDGRFTSGIATHVELTVEESPIGRRIRVAGPIETTRSEQDIVLWDDVDRVELTTRLHDYSGHDRLFRVRFPIAIEGGASVSEVGNAVVGRPFGRPNVDVAEVPFTLDHPAYNWFALGATARVALGDGKGEAAREARASRAISVAEVIVPDEAAQDDAVRGLVVALVRQGVTSTLSRHSGHRYGILHIDSNLPDVRVAVGGPKENQFVAAVLAAAPSGYRAELDRQLKARGWARLWIPEDSKAADDAHGENIPDLRGPRDLPVLVIAGRDSARTIAAIKALSADLADGVIGVGQPAALDGETGRAEDYTLAVINRGIPGFSVEADGNMYLSLLRSCSGWPSGVWIDPPRRSTPDGANFQFQHWSHAFEYAIAASPGDWRAGGLVRGGHEYNNPLIALALDAHKGQLPATTSLLQVDPPSVVLTALKPAGNPGAHMTSLEVDSTAGVAMRLYESSGRATKATIRGPWPLGSARSTNVLEEGGKSLKGAGGAIDVRLEPYEIATVRATVDVKAAARGARGKRPDLAPRAEAAQPVFADYWLHNKGAAPVGYQAVSVGIRPSILSVDGPFSLPIVVASERTDGPAAGKVTLVVPPGWKASPAERVYRLAPGAHLAFDVSVRPAAGAKPGRYFVAARIVDEAGQVHEDVVTIDHRTGSDGTARKSDPAERTPALTWAVERALAVGGIGPKPGSSAVEGARHDPGDELVVTFQAEPVRVAQGERGQIRASIKNRAASEIRGEAQILSPHETWTAISPWTQGFVVPPGGETVVTFVVEPPLDGTPGGYWALLKVMYFGRVYYSESIPVEIEASKVVTRRVATATRSR